MRTFTLFFFVLLLLASAFINCSLYGSIARVPHFGISITEYAEKERDVFLLMYIAGGRLLPQNEKIRDMSMSLTRRVYGKSFSDSAQYSEPQSHRTNKSFDLPATLIRILYWVPPFALAMLLIVLLLPRPKPSFDDETQLSTNF